MKKNKPKIKWKVSEPPSGAWRSFYERGWPSAYYKDENESVCADIHCKDEYVPENVKTGNHSELKLRIADHSVTPWKWKVAKTRPKTMKEAKELLLRILEQKPELMGDKNE